MDLTQGGDGGSSAELARSAGADDDVQTSLATASIALSLRVRESASMSLKRIFDQRMMGYGGRSGPEQDCRPNPPPERQTRGFQGLRSQSAPDFWKRGIPELDLTCRKAQDSLSMNAGTGGFGSPVFATTPAPTNQELELRSGLCVKQKQHNPHATPVSSASFRMPPPSRPTSQMTIFYSGNVNVFDDVPADKAHAIMVLASSLSSSTRCTSSSTMAAVAGPASGRAEMKQERTVSPIKAALSQPEVPSPMNSDYANEVGFTKNLSRLASAGSRLPDSPMASPALSTPLVSLAEGASTVQGAGVQGRRPTGLPHFRKASLARFLEKRKDRVVPLQILDADQQGLTGEKGKGDRAENAGSSEKPGNDPPALTSGKRLPSPAPTWEDNYNSEKFSTTKRSRADDEHDDSSCFRNRSLNERGFLH